MTTRDLRESQRDTDQPAGRSRRLNVFAFRGVPLSALSKGFRSPSTNLGVVLVALLLAGSIAFFFRFGGLYLVVFGTILIWYVATMRPSARVGRGSIEATLVAEQIVAIGVASLIFHVALAGFNLRASWVATKKFDGDSIWGAAQLFGEGLICATVAPLAAMWVRSTNVGALEDSREAQETPEFQTINAVMEIGTIGEARQSIAMQANAYSEALGRLASASDAFASQVHASASTVGSSLSSLFANFDAQLSKLTSKLDGTAVSVERSISALNASVDTLSSKLVGVASPIAETFNLLADEIRGGGRALQHGMEDAAKEVRSSGKTLADDFRIVAAGFGDHGRAISRALQGVPEVVEAHVAEISSHIEPLSARLSALEANLGRTQTAAADLAADLPKLYESSALGVQALNDEMSSLAEKMREGAVLLQGLQELIGSVRRFIPSDNEPKTVAQETMT